MILRLRLRNKDGTPKTEELRQGYNYQRYLELEGLDEKDDEADEYDEDEYDDEYDEEELDEAHGVYLISAGATPRLVARIIDENLCCGMDEAMELVTEIQLPCWLTATSKTEAQEFAKALRAAGATIEIQTDEN